MIRLLLENEADCLIRQHTEPRNAPLTTMLSRSHLPRERFRSSASFGQSPTRSRGHSNVASAPGKLSFNPRMRALVALHFGKR
jgi:hypothetical protein